MVFQQRRLAWLRLRERQSTLGKTNNLSAPPRAPAPLDGRRREWRQLTHELERITLSLSCRS
jgi:hypothetical protein